MDAGLARLDGGPVALPSDYDDFGPEGSHDPPRASPEARRHLAALKRAMETAGFLPLREEWWHYVDPDCAAWPILDESFENLTGR